MSDKSPWIPVGELQSGFSAEANILPQNKALEGKKYTLNFENETIAECIFSTNSKLQWVIKDIQGNKEVISETYTATSLRDGIYFIDFINHREIASSVSLVLNINKSTFTTIISKMPEKTEVNKSLLERVHNNEELTPVKVKFIHGTIDIPYQDNDDIHHKTDELVGKRVFYKYSPYEYYEHIYLNKEMYTWHCVAGIEKGLADTDRCHYYKIDDSLYLFVWREKIIPTIGVVMVDLKNGKTTGKIMGYAEDDTDEISNFQVGAYAIELNNTTYNM